MGSSANDIISADKWNGNNNDDSPLTIQNFIGGKFIECDETLDSFDPSVGKVWAKIPDCGKQEVDAAVESAKAAFEKWSETPIQERCRYLNIIADIVESHLEEFAKVESRDQGKTVAFARSVDIPRAILNLRFFAGTAPHLMNKSNYMEGIDALNYTTRMPVGVAGLISPWNLPIYLLTFKLAPALACGNTVVCKPSEMTSVTAWMLCKVIKEAGLPDGVVNMVFGTGPKAGDALVRHPDVPIISFTGSTATAQKLREASAPFCKKLSLELGGKNAAVIFSDANLDKCLPTAVRSSFSNQGEICLCTSRIFVQRPIYKEFLEKFVDNVRQLKVGDPRQAGTSVGALVSKDHMAKVTGYINIGKEEGGTIWCGYSKDKLDLTGHNKEGYFVAPTVISDLPDTSRLMQEEIFGPVTCVVPFDTEEEVIQRINNVPYGLCASVWSQNVSTVHNVARKLQVGTVWSNCWLLRDLHMPFGGMKNSGTGREGCDYSVDFYTELKTVCVKL